MDAHEEERLTDGSTLGVGRWEKEREPWLLFCVHTECVKLLKDDFMWYAAHITGHKAQCNDNSEARVYIVPCVVARANHF